MDNTHNFPSPCGCMVKIGLIGTGMLGEAVGLHLLKSGFSLVVYNRTKSKTKSLEENGATISDTPKHLAQSSELIITCVKDGDASEQILFGQDGVVAGKHDGLAVAEMSTISPNSAIQNSKRLNEEKNKLAGDPSDGRTKCCH